MHGPGAVADKGAALKQQRRSVRGWVKTAFGGQLPGQPRVVAATARDGRGGVAEASTSQGGTPAAATPQQAAPAPRRRPQATEWVDPLLAEIEAEAETV